MSTENEVPEWLKQCRADFQAERAQKQTRYARMAEIAAGSEPAEIEGVTISPELATVCCECHNNLGPNGQEEWGRWDIRHVLNNCIGWHRNKLGLPDLPDLDKMLAELSEVDVAIVMVRRKKRRKPE